MSLAIQSPATGAHAAMLCFGEVRHRRLRPAPNRFSYGVFFMRLPLRSLETTATAGETRLFSRNRFNLLSFHDTDHGDGVTPLTLWIDTLLKSEGIADADGEVWLQAFPRVLGYVFNPVTFWYCHRGDGALRAILCQVDNTFGERHFYLLDTGTAMPFGAELIAKKVFHVSPFCRIEGGYRFRFMQSERGTPDCPAFKTVVRIDHYDADGPLLETSVSGTGHVLSDRLLAKAFFTYPMMTFGVMARIHWQALRLWLKRVPFIRKPAAPSKELTR